MEQQNNLITELLTWQQQLEHKRNKLENTWQDVAAYIRPERNYFSKQNSVDLAKNIYDSTALLASEFLISSVWSMVSSSSNQWFHLKPLDNSLLKDPKIHCWFKEVNLQMQANLISTASGFYYKSYEFYSDLICFGTAIFYVGENIQDNSLIYTCKNLAKCYLDQTNYHIDTLFEKFSLTRSEAIKQFGLDSLSPELINCTDDTKHEFIHAVVPSNYLKNKVANLIKMQYSSYYIEVNNKNLVASSGYHEFPYIVARWFSNSNNLYGESQSMNILPDIKMLNAISKTLLIAIQKQVDPPILAPNEAVIQGVKTNPGGVIYGGIDPVTGNQLFKPLVSGIDLTSANLLQQQKRESIREAFYYSLLFNSYRANTTATEIISINEQKMQLLGAKIARIQTEFLYPLLLRQYKVMLRLDKFPHIPNTLNPEEVEVEFLGIWNRYQKTIQALGTTNFTNIIERIKIMNPEITNILDWSMILKIIAEGNGVPNKVFNQ
ncbi:portal protein [Rickettsiales bacterium LUAb2]